MKKNPKIFLNFNYRIKIRKTYFESEKTLKSKLIKKVSNLKQ